MLEKIRDFLKPDSFKLMVFFLLLSVFLLVTALQISIDLATANLFIYEQLEAMNYELSDGYYCLGNEDCLSESSLAKLQGLVYLRAGNETFYQAQLDDLEYLKTAKAVLYPRLFLIVDRSTADYFNIDLNLSEFDKLFTREHKPAEEAIPFILYLYLVSCTIAVFKGAILKRTQSRLDTVN